MLVGLAIRSARGIRRSVPWAALTLVLAAALMVSTGGARAAYRGFDGAIARTVDASGPAGLHTEEVIAPDVSSPVGGPIQLASCDGDSLMSLSCFLGAPSYSRDGRRIVVSRQGLPLVGHGRQGSLLLIGADGTGARSLVRQTADDEHPAFLPSGNRLVFDGRRSPKGAVNLFTVGTNGAGLRQLTGRGGSQPAPCADGTKAPMSSARHWGGPGGGEKRADRQPVGC